MNRAHRTLRLTSRQGRLVGFIRRDQDELKAVVSLSHAESRLLEQGLAPDLPTLLAQSQRYVSNDIGPRFVGIILTSGVTHLETDVSLDGAR